VVNHKKVQRLWREEGLRVPIRTRRKRVGASTDAGTPTADEPNSVWAFDFQYDATENGRPIKILSIIDEYTRENIGGLVERSINATQVVEEFSRVIAARGAPKVIRCDNGPEMISKTMSKWAAGTIDLHYIPPGTPWNNGWIESFNGRMRDECLNINSFWSITQAQVVIGDWRYNYNHHRRHSALGYKTPAEFATTHKQNPKLPQLVA
jgi:transposase InsO family protein